MGNRKMVLPRRVVRPPCGSHEDLDGFVSFYIVRVLYTFNKRNGCRHFCDVNKIFVQHSRSIFFLSATIVNLSRIDPIVSIKGRLVDNSHCRKVSSEIRYERNDIEELEFKECANNRACKSNINLGGSFTFRINPYTREGLVNTPLRPRNTTLPYRSIDLDRFHLAASRWIFLRQSMAITIRNSIYVNFASILIPRLLAR